MATIDHTIPGADRSRGVFNQASPLPEMNLFDTDVALREALDRHGGGWGVDRVRDIGQVAGSAEAREHARRAELHAPVLKTHDRFGNRIDEVESDPSWHWLLRTAVEREVPSFSWRDPSPGSQVVRLAMAFLWAQVDSGVMCPLIMTFSSVPALQRYGGEKGAEWVDRLTTPDYEKGALCGQAYTEKQAGSDLRQTTTTAEPLGDGSYEIWGHKWFCSAPMCDAFLTVAQTDQGLTCFLIERGEGVEIVRLKEKLGTRTLPTAEIELKGVRGWLVGEEGEGFDPLMRNLGHARLGPAAAPEMRAALIRAIHHCRGRSAFGRPLVEQPLMANVLASLAVQSEAATMTAVYLASAYEEFDSPLRRLLTSIMEYQGCGGVTPFVAEAMECLGGNGYSEASEMPRLLRNASVHSIWEGSGNVVALDVLRTMAKSPEAVPMLIAECERARGADPRLDRHLDALKQTLVGLAESEDPQFLARRVVGDMAVAFQASMLSRHAPHLVADAYCGAHLEAGCGGGRYGTLPAGIDAAALIERALPV